MAKKPTLLDAIKSLPDKKNGKPTWMERLQKHDADLYGQMIELVDKWLAGDVSIRRKLPSQAAVADWLCPLLADRGFPLKPHTITQAFAARRSNGQTAQ